MNNIWKIYVYNFFDYRIIYLLYLEQTTYFFYFA